MGTFLVIIMIGELQLAWSGWDQWVRDARDLKGNRTSLSEFPCNWVISNGSILYALSENPVYNELNRQPVLLVHAKHFLHCFIT